MIKSPFPDHIRTVAVVAPAGAANPEKLAAGIQILREFGLRVKPGAHLIAPASQPYYAARLEARIADFNAAICDPEVDMIIAARGGFGSAQLLESIDYATLRARQLPVVGYSDITAIHAAMLAERAGIPIAAPMVASLARACATENNAEFTLRTMQTAFRVTDGALVDLPMPSALTPVLTPAGEILGRPFAANLTVLNTLCGTKYFPDMAGRIVIIEDVNEELYRIDRALTQLCMCGALKRISALIFGHFTAPDGSELDIQELARRYAQQLSGAVFSGFEFGHSFPLTAVNATANWRIAAGRITVMP